MNAKQRASEQAQIASMLADIEATRSGGPAVDALRKLGYRVRFGRPLGGGAFTYPWKVITLRRGHPQRVTLAMLIHELGHVLFASKHKWLWSGSVEQEYAASRFWARVSSELGILSAGLEAKWLGPNDDSSELANEIRRPTAWHRVALPSDQRYGLADKFWALWQALASVTWVVSRLRGRRPGHSREQQIIKDADI